MIYAATYPEQVAGMVLLDSSSPSQFTAVPAYPTQYAFMRRGLASCRRWHAWACRWSSVQLLAA